MLVEVDEYLPQPNGDLTDDDVVGVGRTERRAQPLSWGQLQSELWSVCSCDSRSKLLGVPGERSRLHGHLDGEDACVVGVLGWSREVRRVLMGGGFLRADEAMFGVL